MEEQKLEIRIATQEDLSGINHVYNASIKEGVSTLDRQTKDLYQWRLWYQEAKNKGYIIYVAVEKDQIVGYANISAFRKKDGFAETVEIDVYVLASFRGKGIGSALAETLLENVKNGKKKVHIVISVINTDNEISRHMEEKFGFTLAGALPEVAKKFGQYQGIEYFYKIVE